MILFCWSAEELANFMRDCQSALADEVRRLYGWTGKLWQGRYKHSVLVDEDIQKARLRYVLEQGCKENLVARPQDWPGVTGIDAILENKDLYGTWYDRSAYYEACRARKTKVIFPAHCFPPRHPFITKPIALTPL